MVSSSVDIGFGIRAAGIDGATRGMEIGERPVDEIEVEIVQLQIVEGLAEGGDDVFFGVFVIPELGSDPEFLAFDAAVDDGGQGGADEVFVGINGSTVEMAVPDGCGLAHGCGNGFIGCVIGPSAEHLMAGMRAPEARMRWGTVAGLTGRSEFVMELGVG